ncbi:DUF421 domain-containing protein [Pediococcus siamensis]|uniref:DUF421 domain-containing protein n=1 Tax=Pediococcus siamensis TaxID=381829 RepID=UPI00399FF132
MWLLIGAKLVIGLIGLLIVVRLLGKKSMAEITPFDLIYTLVLGGILEETVYDEQVHLGHLLFAIGIWALLIFFIEKVVQKNERINRWIKGEPSILIKDGVLNVKEIDRNKIEMEQLREMARQNQCFSLENARHIILENAGQVSMIVKSEKDKVLAIMLVDQGKIQKKVLASYDLSEDWLRANLAKLGFVALEKLVYVEWSQEKGFYVITPEKTTNQIYRIDG